MLRKQNNADSTQMGFWTIVPGVLCALFVMIGVLFLGSPVIAQSDTGLQASRELSSAVDGISFENGRLSIDVTDVSIADVLKEIARKSHISIKLHDDIKGRTTIRMVDVTVEESLRRLSRNHALIFERSPDNRSYQIVGIGAFGESALSVESGEPSASGGDPQGKRKAGSSRMSLSTGSGDSPSAHAVEKPDRRLDRKGRLRYKPGELLIRFKPDIPETRIIELHRLLGSTVLSRMDRSRLQKIKLKDGLSETEAIDQYTASNIVEIAEKHALRYTNELIPDDPYFSEQWGLPVIRAPEAWSVERNAAGVVIAVIDTGVDYLHPDLKDNIWVNEAEAEGSDGVDDDDNGYVDDVYGWDFAGQYQFVTGDEDEDPDPMDVDGHGTHVAGIIGAEGNNGLGVAGVSWNARIMALKVQADGAEEMESWDVIHAIDYAIRNGAKIVNCSFGGEEDSSDEEDAFARLKSAGILAVCAAGNDGLNIDVTESYPAGFALDNIISVAAGNQNDALAGFSNYGATSVDVMAPGDQIKSTIVGGTYTEAFVTVNTNGDTALFGAIGMAYSGVTGDEGITGEIYDCGRGYSDEFPSGISDYIALIQRGKKEVWFPDFYFYEKVENAQTAGAMAVIIYNHEPGSFSGTLGSIGNWVPVVSVSKEDGEIILGLVDKQPTIALFNRTNDTVLYYTYKSGTSMAAPMVAGIAGLMLEKEPSLGYLDIKNRIMDSVHPIASAAEKIMSGGRVDALSALCSINIVPGDLSCDAQVGLGDALLSLQLISGVTPAICPTCIPGGVDVNGDGYIGLADTIYMLQKVGGVLP